jgi:hypothetical protein
MSFQWKADANAFFNHLRKLEQESRQQFAKWNNDLAGHFLDEVRKQIIDDGAVNTGHLLSSFTKGNGIWRMENRGLTLEIGSDLDYASAVNDGHQQERRFVPGQWSGDTFHYDPSNSGGIMLTARWVEGTHYFDTAEHTFNTMFNKTIKKNLEKWFLRGDGSR